MLAIIILLLAMVVLLVLVTRFAAMASGKVLGATTAARHKAAEHIIATGQPPGEWIAALARRSRRGERARRALLARLDGLIGYFKTASVFEDEETRRILLHELRKARDAWAALENPDALVEKGAPPREPWSARTEGGSG